MNRAIPYTDANKVEHIQFYCPGCCSYHSIVHKRPADDGSQGLGMIGPVWRWNQTLEMPTFNPSVLVQWTYGPQKRKFRCHSFVRNGQIQFLKDCTHKFAGQTVDLQDEGE